MPIQRVCHLMIGQQAAPAGDPFVFTIQTTGVDETFTLPLEVSGSYDFAVDWGDTNSDNISAWDDAAKTHTYSSAGTYEISITGTLTGFRFNYSGDYVKIYEIKAWGILRLGNSNGYFEGCSNLTVTATDILNLTGTTTLKQMFSRCSSLTTVPSMDSWDVSNIIDMYGLFYRASLFNQDISSWNVSNVTDMYGLFYRATVFNQNISSWDVSKVMDMYTMFYMADAFNQNISSWNVSNVTDMGGTFSYAIAFNQNIGNWNVSSVVYMYEMFAGATVFDQDIGNWNVLNVTTMSDMFNGVTLSIANYDALLIEWEAQAVKNNVTFHGGNSKYSAGAAATARANLIADHSWIISDGGQA